jgi:hypothetical protein
MQLTYSIGYLRGRAGGAGLWQVRRDHAPLSVGQIGLVSVDGAAMLLSSDRCPHGESNWFGKTPWNHLWRHHSILFKNWR